MRLADIMTKQVITTTANTPLAEAREEMRRHGVHHLVVVDGKHPIGVLSGHDGDQRGTVRDAMHAPVVTATVTTTVREAANLLRGRIIGCLPVLEDDRLVGIVTISDLLELIGRGVERPVAESVPWTVGRKPDRAQKRR